MPTLMRYDTYDDSLPSDVERQDDVNSPQHYNTNGLETIDLTIINTKMINNMW